MNIDILGSEFTNKLKAFKNFPYTIVNVIEGQSVISLFSSPIHTDMSELSTTELDEITFAYRDLNKTHAEKFRNSESTFLLLDLYSELDDICEIDGSYFSPESVKFLDNRNGYWKLAKIEKFRAFQKTFEKLSSLISKYEKVILVLRKGEKHDNQEYLDALYEMIMEKADNLLLVTVSKDRPDIDDRDLPLEVYNDINLQIKKFRAKDYDEQFLFSEGLENDNLSVFVNHIEKRSYVYELYKNGSPVKKTEPSTDRKVSFKLDGKGKFRIRVNLADESIPPRFSKTYEYSGLREESNDSYDYLEIDSHIDTWKLELLDETYDIKGYIGNPYTYPNGLNGSPVYMRSEISSKSIISSSDVNEVVLGILYAKEDEILRYLKEQYADNKEALFMIDFVLRDRNL
ncbi:MAG TPA: hypothetical protein VK135_00345 [Candidatus Dormibacteraeota bacterium]|nr:hypothetical protein [Candidatus Dormibacteraeota bacterium]